jgi:hypothetical protein
VFSKRFSLTAAGRRLLGRKEPSPLDDERQSLLDIVDSDRGPDYYALRTGKSEQWVESVLTDFAHSGLVEPRESVRKMSPAARRAAISAISPTEMSASGFTSMFAGDTGGALNSHFPDTDFHIHRPSGDEPEEVIPENLDWFERYARAKSLMTEYLLRNLGELGPSSLAREIERAGASEKLLTIFPRYRSFIAESGMPSGPPHLGEIGRLLNMPVPRL